MTAMSLNENSVKQNISNVDWSLVHKALDENGIAVIKGLISEANCQYLSSLYLQSNLFRSRIVMSRHGYGQGEYQYFSYPLPPLISELRQHIYPYLVPKANQWNVLMGLATEYPQTHEKFIHRCHQAGQSRPTPLLLKYESGDYNCLHQDLYGEHFFPLQLAILLSKPKEEFAGGELVLTEQRPRMLSRVEVIPLQQGDAAVFAVNQRPKQGSRGYYRVNMRHGVSTVRSGHRMTAGLIFHDAK